MSAVLTRTAAVFRLACASPGCVCRTAPPSSQVSFIVKDDDTQAVTRALDLAITDWHDMGSPETITVSIEPGDTLNP